MNLIIALVLATIFGVAVGTVWATHVLTRHFEARLESRDQMWRDSLARVADRTML